MLLTQTFNRKPHTLHPYLFIRNPRPSSRTTPNPQPLVIKPYTLNPQPLNPTFSPKLYLFNPKP